MSNVAWNLVKTGLYIPIRTWGKINAINYDIQNTVIVACPPRGGSTWIAEILQTMPGYMMLWEPFHKGINPESSRYGFSSRTYIPDDAIDKQKSDYLYRLLTGRALSPRLISRKHFKFNQVFKFKGYIAKILRGQRFLSWMLNQYPTPTVFMLRHPCAVIASQMKHPAWSKVVKGNYSLSMTLKTNYPHLIPIGERVQTVEESLALTWAIDAYIPLHTSKPHLWHLMTYESLVEDGKNELERMFQYLKKPVPPQAYQQVKTLSTTTEATSPLHHGDSALSGWQKSLTTDQIDRILRIVHDVGVDFYTDSLHPDYKKMGIER